MTLVEATDRPTAQPPATCRITLFIKVDAGDRGGDTAQEMGREQTDILAMPAQRRDLDREDAQRFGLKIQRDLAHLIQKERTTVGELEAPDAIAQGPGEGRSSRSMPPTRYARESWRWPRRIVRKRSQQSRLGPGHLGAAENRQDAQDVARERSAANRQSCAPARPSPTPDL
jgi:hypothetical protein